MPISDIDTVFSGATISDFELQIPSGALISCPEPDASNPKEIIFGLLETIYQNVSGDPPTNLSVTSSALLVDESTYRKTYNFVVNLDFNGASIIEGLNVKADAAPE